MDRELPFQFSKFPCPQNAPFLDTLIRAGTFWGIASPYFPETHPVIKVQVPLEILS